MSESESSAPASLRRVFESRQRCYMISLLSHVLRLRKSLSLSLMRGAQRLPTILVRRFRISLSLLVVRERRLEPVSNSHISNPVEQNMILRPILIHVLRLSGSCGRISLSLSLLIERERKRMRRLCNLSHLAFISMSMYMIEPAYFTFLSLS